MSQLAISMFHVFLSKYLKPVNLQKYANSTAHWWLDVRKSINLTALGVPECRVNLCCIKIDPHQVSSTYELSHIYNNKPSSIIHDVYAIEDASKQERAVLFVRSIDNQYPPEQSHMLTKHGSTTLSNPFLVTQRVCADRRNETRS
jgi:hypothetical protein